MWVCNTSLISRGTSTGIELLSVFIGFRALLEQAILLTQHVDDQASLLANAAPPIHPVLIVAEVAQRRDLIHVAFELDDGRWRPILDDEFDGGEGLEHAAPLRGRRFQLGVEELSDPINVLPTP